MVTGFAIVLIAGLLQGSFVLPMALTRKWRWEHTWAAFSVFGMFLFNWALAAASMPNLIEAFRSAPAGAVALLLLFGLGWGVGAILFGLGMERLGMALGYPIIMGLIACLGALIPMAILFPETLLMRKGLILLAGTALAVTGIVLCSIGGRRKQPDSAGGAGGHGGFSGALTIAILAGVLSCFPNVGIAFGEPIIKAALAHGTPTGLGSTAVFVLFFTAGGVVNCAYCAWLMRARRHDSDSDGETGRNLMLAALMAALWIGSFYLYGIGSRRLGDWGVIAGWPLFISISIGTGVLWGLWKGEWRGAPLRARIPRNWGLGMLFCAVVVIALSGRF
jgi:L-rhamnose-H+ transport protein